MIQIYIKNISSFVKLRLKQKSIYTIYENWQEIRYFRKNSEKL